MDHFDEAGEFAKSDQRFAQIVRVAGGPNSVASAVLAARAHHDSGEAAQRTYVPGDFDGSVAAALAVLADVVTVLVGYYTIRDQLRQNSVHIDATRLVREVQKRAKRSWRVIARVTDVTSLILGLASRDGVLEPLHEYLQRKFGTPNASKSNTVWRRIRDYAMEVPFWLISILGSAFPIAWLLGATYRGDAIALLWPMVGTYFAWAAAASIVRSWVMGRELRHASERLDTGEWRLVDTQSLPADPTPFSVLQSVVGWASKYSPTRKRVTKFVARVDANSDSPQALTTMLPMMNEYILLSLPAGRTPSPNDPQYIDYTWTLTHEISHLIDPTARARKGSLPIAMLGAAVGVTLLAPVAFGDPSALLYVGAIVVAYLLRWAVDSTFSEAQADFIGLMIIAVQRFPPDKLRAFAEDWKERHRYSILSGPLHHRAKAWIRWKLLLPSWRALTGLHESPAKRLSQLNNIVFGGISAVIAWRGGYHYGIFDSYGWYVGGVLAALVIVAYTAVILLARRYRAFDAKVNDLPPLPIHDEGKVHRLTA
jgi:hypothetical protein